MVGDAPSRVKEAPSQCFAVPLLALSHSVVSDSL